MKKTFFFLSFIFSISLISAPLLTIGDGSDSDLPRVEIITPDAFINSSLQYVNSSDWWDDLDTPSDIPGSEFWYNHTLDVFNLWNSTWDNRNTVIDTNISYTHLSNFTDDILWTTGFNTTFDSRVTGDNVTWNQSFATTLYADIKWGTNQSLSTFDLWNDTWDNRNTVIDTNISYTHLSNFTDDILWTTGFNTTFDSRVTGDNVTWNETGADIKYANISWNYNQSLATFEMWNDTWSSVGFGGNPFDQTLNITDEVVFGGLNVTSNTSSNLVLHNTSYGDEQFGRASRIIFKGESLTNKNTSTIAIIEASHRGDSGTEASWLRFFVNSMMDGDNPKEVLKISNGGSFAFGFNDTDGAPTGLLHAKLSEYNSFVISDMIIRAYFDSYYNVGTQPAPVMYRGSDISWVWNSYDARMLITNNTAGVLVGINTDYPTEKLEVTGNIYQSNDSDKFIQGQSKDISYQFNGSDEVCTAEVGSPNYYFDGFSKLITDSSFEAGLGAFGGTPASQQQLLVERTTADVNSRYGLHIDFTPQATTNGTYNTRGLSVNVEPQSNASGHNAGSINTIRAEGLTDADHNGTIATISGLRSLFGHNTGTIGNTTDAYGLAINPYIKGGVITNMYNIYLTAPQIGGTVTNPYSIYDDSGWNWVLDGNNQHIILGENQQGNITYNGSDMNIGIGSGDLYVSTGYTGTCVNATYKGGIVVGCND